MPSQGCVCFWPESPCWVQKDQGYLKLALATGSTNKRGSCWICQARYKRLGVWPSALAWSTEQYLLPAALLALATDLRDGSVSGFGYSCPQPWPGPNRVKHIISGNTGLAEADVNLLEDCELCRITKPILIRLPAIPRCPHLAPIDFNVKHCLKRGKGYALCVLPSRLDVLRKYYNPSEVHPVWADNHEGKYPRKVESSLPLKPRENKNKIKL